MSGVTIEMKDISKSFDNYHKVLNKINCSIKSNESIVILGESGAGKSVLMRIIGMLLYVNSGSILIDSEEIVGISDSKRNAIMRKIGFLFQNSGLFEHLNTWENVAFRELFIDRERNISKVKEKAFEKLKLVGIRETAFYLKPNEISGGMQKRVSMARTIMKNPKLILLDEPTSGLDPIMSERINELIINTKNNVDSTIITITHDLNSALKISDKIFVLKKGEFIWHGETKKIHESSDKYVQDFIKASNISII